MSHATTHSVRLRVHDTALACQVSKAIGYAARCACGWEGPIRRRYDDARGDARGHTECCRTISEPPCK